MSKLAQSGFGNFDFIDWKLKAILRERRLV
jgi:hypothetical protein